MEFFQEILSPAFEMMDLKELDEFKFSIDQPIILTINLQGNCLHHRNI